MNRNWLPAVGVALVLVGLLGVLATGVMMRETVGPSAGRTGPGQRSQRESVALGRRIYVDGVGEGGRRVPRRGSMMGRGCADCHGRDARGREIGMMMGRIETPDIRYATLTSERTEDGERVAPWTEADIARAVREGVEPDGGQLQPPMARWQLTDAEMAALLAYLKRL